MVLLKTSIPEELDNKFRKIVARKFGAKRGALKKAIQEAIIIWLENELINSQLKADKGSSISRQVIIDKYPGQFVLLAGEQVAGHGSSMREAVKKAHEEYPKGTEFTLIHAVPKIQRKAQLGWRIRRRIG